SLQIIGLSFITTPPATPEDSSDGDVITDGSAQASLSVSPVSGATKYSWYNGSTLIATTVNPSYSPTVSSTTTFDVAAVTDFCESMGRIPVRANVYPKAIVTASNNARVTMGEPVVLSVDNFTYENYIWFKDGDPIYEGVTLEVYTEGYYTVQVRKGGSGDVAAVNTIHVRAGVSGQNMNYI